MKTLKKFYYFSFSFLVATLMLINSCKTDGRKATTTEERKATITEERTENVVEEMPTTKAVKNSNKVSFDANFLSKLIVLGEYEILRFKQDEVELTSRNTGSTRKASYDAANPTLKNAVAISGNEIKVSIHQNFAVGGEIIIKKEACSPYSQLPYSFALNWETEQGDSGCAFHPDEEFEITAKVSGVGFGTGGDFYMFTDGRSNSYAFYHDPSRGANLQDVFPKLDPMSDDNPYSKKSYRVIYKFMGLEDHRGFRAEPVVVFIEEK